MISDDRRFLLRALMLAAIVYILIVATYWSMWFGGGE